MIIIKKLIKLLVLGLIPQIAFAIDWPIPNVNNSDYIGGVYLEYRSQRFHYGIDIVKKSGTEIYSISNGYITKIATSTGENNIAPWNQLIAVSETKNGNKVWQYGHTRDFNRVPGSPSTAWKTGHEVFQI